MQVVVAAGGAGTRLAPVLGDIPKVLAPISGTPFLVLLLRKLHSDGHRRVHLCLGHAANRVQRALAQYSLDGMTITSTVESRPLGVIGALRLALDALESSFFFIYGDVYPTVPSGALKFMCQDNIDAVLAACPQENSDERANLRLRGDCITHYGKNLDLATHVDVGALVLRRRSIAALAPLTRVDETAFYGELAAAGRLAAVQWPHASRHIGTPQDYADFCRWWALAGAHGSADEHLSDVENPLEPR